jgi:hypothetical protein
LQAGYGLACVTSAIDRHHMGYSGPLTRLRPETVYDQARSRLVFRKRYYGHIVDWLLFWGMIYPASSVVYFRQMVRSSSNTWSLLRSYVRGTLDGISATDRLTIVRAGQQAPVALSEVISHPLTVEPTGTSDQDISHTALHGPLLPGEVPDRAEGEGTSDGYRN